MAVWDELKLVLTRLRDQQPGTLLQYPMPEVDEGRQPPFTIRLAARATATAAELHRQFGENVDLTVGALPYPPGRRLQRPPQLHRPVHHPEGHFAIGELEFRATYARRTVAAQGRDGLLVATSKRGRRVHLSPPAVAERVRRLEESGVIAGYQARVDPARAGMPLTAFIQMRCANGRCLLKTTSAEDLPEVVEIHKLSGNSCSMLKVRVASMRHLEGLLERLGEHGEMNSHVVLSTQYEGRPVEQPDAHARTVTPSAGWSR